MVITPKQVQENLTKADKTQLKKLEQMIDINLKQGVNTINVIGGLSPCIRSVVLKDYRAAGWDVQYLVDDKQVNYLFFKEPREPMGFRV